MPKINPNDYQDWEDPSEFEILEDEPTDRAGRRVKPQPKQVPRVDQDWLANRKRLQDIKRRRSDD